MIFTSLIAANGYRTQIVRNVDPVLGIELNAELEPVPTGLPPKQRLRGTIVDEHGKPVFGALVSIHGALQNDRNWWGRVDNVDKATLTGSDGTFLLTSTEAYQAWRLEVNATGFVELKTGLLTTGDAVHKLALDPGTSVSGTILKDGKPASGVTVGICQTNRGSDQFAGEYVIATDKNGHFLFTSVIAGESMTIYSKMEKGNAFATEIAEFTTASKSGESVDLGNFELQPAKTIVGKITIVDGTPLPKDFRISVGRKYAWDTQTVDVDTKGNFRVQGLPLEEAIKISIKHKGYSVDHSKTNLQVTGQNAVAVFTDSNRNSVEIFLKPDR